MIPAGPELVVIVALAVLLFGAQKLPKLARAVGRSRGELEAGLEESRD